jgi:hypothetical protein
MIVCVTINVADETRNSGFIGRVEDGRGRGVISAEDTWIVDKSIRCCLWDIYCRYIDEYYFKRFSLHFLFENVLCGGHGRTTFRQLWVYLIYPLDGLAFMTMVVHSPDHVCFLQTNQANLNIWVGKHKASCCLPLQRSMSDVGYSKSPP